MEFETPLSEEVLPVKETSSSKNSIHPGDIKMPVIHVDTFSKFQDIINSEGSVLVKFEAAWCMPCKAMASVVEEIANQHPDVKVLAVDIELEGMDDLLLEYGVRSLPTFVHLRKGTKVSSACGTISKAELSSLISG